MDTQTFRRIGDTHWQIDPSGAMRVPAIIHASEKLISGMDDKVREQERSIRDLSRKLKDFRDASLRREVRRKTDRIRSDIRANEEEVGGERAQSGHRVGDLHGGEWPGSVSADEGRNGASLGCRVDEVMAVEVGAGERHEQIAGGAGATIDGNAGRLPIG